MNCSSINLKQNSLAQYELAYKYKGKLHNDVVIANDLRNARFKLSVMKNCKVDAIKIVEWKER